MIELLQIPHPAIAMNEVTFTLSNLFTIGIGIVGVTVSFITLKMKITGKQDAYNIRFKSIEKQIEKQSETIDEEKRSNKEEFKELNKILREILLHVKKD
jgi:predicted tellurium resistance membrane protein TerC